MCSTSATTDDLLAGEMSGADKKAGGGCVRFHIGPLLFEGCRIPSSGDIQTPRRIDRIDGRSLTPQSMCVSERPHSSPDLFFAPIGGRCSLFTAFHTRLNLARPVVAVSFLRIAPTCGLTRRSVLPHSPAWASIAFLFPNRLFCLIYFVWRSSSESFF